MREFAELLVELVHAAQPGVGDAARESLLLQLAVSEHPHDIEGEHLGDEHEPVSLALLEGADERTRR